MKLYEIRQLTICDGDHFNDSYHYRRIGVTDDPELVKFLKSLKITKELADASRWPMACMEMYPWYEIVEVETLTADELDIKRALEVSNNLDEDRIL
jgi:hypothetical protein